MKTEKQRTAMTPFIRKPEKAVFIVFLSVFLIMEIFWLCNNLDLHSFDCTLHLNHFLDTKENFENFIKSPDLANLKNLIISKDALHKRCEKINFPKKSKKSKNK